MGELLRGTPTEMLKWILTLVVALFLLGIAAPYLVRFMRLGQLPGDVVFRFRGRSYNFPFTTTIILSALLFLFGRLL